MRRALLLAMLVLAAPAYAQEPHRIQADLRTEGDHIKQSCSDFTLKSVFSCVVTFATEDPFHLAIGSLSPQNGVAFGAAFSEHSTFGERWRVNWNADAVTTFSGSWRAGAYMKAVYIADEPIGIVPIPAPGTPTPSTPNAAEALAVLAHPVINAYVETTSLETLHFYGLGPDSTPAGKSAFGMKQTIIGTNIVYPITAVPLRPLRLSLAGGLNGRFISIRSNTQESVPSIDQLYNDTGAPGLSSQPGFAQFTEGVRIRPSWIGGHLQPNYFVSFDQFVASSDSHASFHRWTIDLNHEIPLYTTRRSDVTKEFNGPDSCAQAFGGRCPPISYSRNRGGTIGFRFLLSGSSAASGNAIPFYLQPTLGGSDLNGNAALPSYDDYRFRAPNVILLQESIEHSVWGPIGLAFQADQGKVTLDSGDLDFTDLKHSFAVGITIRAGGFPQIFLMYAWGGGEGNHTIARINASVLGGGSRPSLF